MKRCGQAAKDEDVEVFIVGNTKPCNDATVPILCEDCGKTFFTNPDNRTLVIERGMQVCCIPCACRNIADKKDEFCIAGKIYKGKIVKFGV